jgi:hypothetical protein
MGNFYGNITLATNDAAAVANVLRDLRRDAYVSDASDFVVVFDSVELDTTKVKGLLGDLTKQLDCAGLAVMNADDDVLEYLLAERGRVVDEYDSNPGYDTGRSAAPSGGKARLLCVAFSRAESEERVHAVLHGQAPTFEVERHEALVNALGLPATAVGIGYRYIGEGEAEDAGLTDLQRIGAAPEP